MTSNSLLPVLLVQCLFCYLSLRLRSESSGLMSTLPSCWYAFGMGCSYQLPFFKNEVLERMKQDCLGACPCFTEPKPPSS